MLLNGPTCANNESQVSGSLLTGSAARFNLVIELSLDLVELTRRELGDESLAYGFEVLGLQVRGEGNCYQNSE